MGTTRTTTIRGRAARRAAGRTVPIAGCVAAAVLPGPRAGLAGAPLPPPAAPAPVPAVTFERGAGRVAVRIDGAPFTALVYADVQKPMLHPLLGPGGERVTRGFPMEPRADEEPDHPHQTSQWFAHGAVNGGDFWSGAKGARIVAAGEPVTDARSGTLEAAFEWRDGAGGVLCTERRIMRFAGDETSRTIDFDITLTAVDGPITFGDTKEGTFGLRLAATLRLRGPVAAGSCLNSAGQRDGDCWGKRAAWVEYSGPVDGRELGVAIFDHPGNPRHPTWWHARDYGLVAANPFGAHDFEGARPGTGDLALAAGAALRFRYRVLIHAGAWTSSRIDAAHRAWVDSGPPSRRGGAAP